MFFVKSEFDKEFNQRIKHDFRKYLLLTSNGSHLSEEAILWAIYKMEGYKRHKKVKYGEFTSHIVVIFIDVYAALEATARLNQMSCGLRAVLVDDMLRGWFDYEKKTCSEPPCSLTIVDIIGRPPLDLNFLKSNIIREIFQDFGAPYLLPYTAALNEPHMQVLFSSMTESLAACIAFGEWYCLGEKADCFFYRVRISPSTKEEKLIKNCDGTPPEAFKLSYFITLKKEAKIETATDSLTKNNESKLQHPVTKILNLHNPKCPPVENSNIPQVNIFGRGTPVLYFPILATNPCNRPALTSNKLNVEFTTALLNLHHTLAARPVVAIPYLETASDRTRLHQDLVRTAPSRCDENQNLQSNASNCNIKVKNKIPILQRARDNRRRATRIFERRK